MKTSDKKRKKIPVLTIAVLVTCVVLGGFGVTIAMMRARAEPATNKFNGAAVNIGVVENGKTIEKGSNDNEYTKVTSGTPIAKEVAIINITSEDYPTSDTYVRVRLVPSFRYDSGDKAGQLLPIDMTNKVTYIYSDDHTGWKKDTSAGETYYYYTEAIAPGDTSKKLLKTVTYTGNVPENAHFELQVLAEGISAKQTGALKDVWGLDDFEELSDL